jgi:hypothetical protein
MEQFLLVTRPHIIGFEDFNDKEFDRFVQNINETNHLPNRQVFLKSYGGSADLISAFIEIVKNSQAKLVADSRIYSAGFISFFQANVERKILNSTVGMFHYPYLPSARLTPDNKLHVHTKLDDFLLKKAKWYDEKYFKELLEITTPMHKDLKEGGQLVYGTRDLRKILKKSEEMFGN